jgi:hypothetical protein
MHFWLILTAAMRFAPKILARERASRAASAASARLTSRQRGGEFCIDPEQERPAGAAGAQSSSNQNHGADCLAAVRVR